MMMSHFEEMRNALKGVRASIPPLRKRDDRRTPPPPWESPFKGRSQSGASGCRPLALPAGRRTAMHGRLRRREAELYASIRDAESAGMDYTETIRPLLVELRDILAKRNAPEALRGAITPEALSVHHKTLEPPQGPVIGLTGQNSKGTLK